MKKSIFVVFIALIGCNSTNMTHSVSNWSLNPADNTSKLKAVTSYYGVSPGLLLHTLDILSQLGFEIENSTNPVITKPKILFGKAVKYFITYNDPEVIITGQVAESSIAGPPDLNSRNFIGTTIVKGPNQFGTPWFERMTVIAQAMRGATIYYSE